VVAVAGPEENSRPFPVVHAGEYEVQGIFATGIRVPKKDGTEHTIYRIFAEGIKVAFLGALDRALTEEENKTLGDIDILLVPVGGGPVLGTDAAQDVVNQVEPRLVVPYYTMVPGCTLTLDSVEPFCKELSCSREDAPKFKISKAGLPEEEMKMVVLSKE
jgi:L-ascorbate metabolism protein UlaG (beta-lactamase superfamily)